MSGEKSPNAPDDASVRRAVASAAPSRGKEDVGATVQAPPRYWFLLKLVTDRGQFLTGAWHALREENPIAISPEGLLVVGIPARSGAVNLGVGTLKKQSKKPKWEDFWERLTIEVWPWETVASFFRLSREKIDKPWEDDDASVLYMRCMMSNAGVLGFTKREIIEYRNGTYANELPVGFWLHSREAVSEAIRRCCTRFGKQFREDPKVILEICRSITSGSRPADPVVAGMRDALEEYGHALGAPNAERVDCATGARTAAMSATPDRRSLSTTRLAPELMGGANSFLPASREGSVGLRPFYFLAHHAWNLGQEVRGRDVTFTRDIIHYTVPGDWPVSPETAWEPDEGIPQTAGVNYLIDGQATFDAMFDAFGAEGTTDVLVIGWSLRIYGLTYRDKAAEEHFLACARKGVRFHFLLWRNLIPGYVNHIQDSLLSLVSLQNDPGVKANGGGFFYAYDSRHRVGGCHHQKIVLVAGKSGVTGFVGGVDINLDRVMPDSEKGWPQHDVHMRLVGEAVGELISFASDRVEWSSSIVKPDQSEASKEVKAAIGRIQQAHQRNPRFAGANLATRFVRTIGTPGRPEPSTLWPAIKAAIGKASRYIYVEDQYFWSFDAADALNAAARRGVKIVMLLPNGKLATATNIRRWAFWKLVNKIDVAQETCPIGVYMLGPRTGYWPGVHTYVHSKTWIIDDDVVFCGSANCNNRGYSHDSECDVKVYDGDWKESAGPRRGHWFKLEYNFARDLRLELWSHHLQVEREALLDPSGAITYWRAQRGNVRVYEDDLGVWSAPTVASIHERRVVDPSA